MLYTNKWLCSYETVAFNTPDKDLDVGQYALTEDKKGYYIRTKPKAEAQFDRVDLTHDISGLTKVQVVPGAHAYYDEFLTAVGATYLWTPDSQYAGFDPSQLPSGSVVRIPSTAAKYNPLRTIPNAPQPSRTETITVLPPPELIIPPSMPHSIGFDATSNSGEKTSISSYSWSHTCAGDNRLLVFGEGHSSTVDRTVIGVTYNGVALTSVRSDSYNTGYVVLRSTIRYLIAPIAATATVSVSLSGTTSRALGGVVSYTGAKQSGQPDASNGAGGTNSPISTAVTTIADNCWVFDVTTSNQPLQACGNTARWNVAGVVFQYGGADTDGPKTPAGSQTMSWTTISGAVWVISAASFAPVAAEARSRGVIIG